MDATHEPTRSTPHARCRVSGCVQVGPARLVIERVENDRYGAGSHGTHYRVEADVQSHWGARPLPGAVWTYTRGISPESEADLLDQVATVYGVGEDRGPSLVSYRGTLDAFPYRSALTDEQVGWLRARHVAIEGTGATISLYRNRRSVEVRADGSGFADGSETTARRAVLWLLAA